MGTRYLTGLADWCRAAGLRVQEVDGWQTRARSSGGYEPGRPWCVMWHHTASKTTPANDVGFIVAGSDDAPIANLYLDRDGIVYVCAAGATNTNGKGGPYRTSRGVVPVDQMNTYAVSIEAANDGVGETWPDVQIDAYFALSNMLTERLELQPADLCHHHSWAPTRKVDPARAEAVDGDWYPRPTNSSGSWNLGDTQDEAERRAGPAPLPPPLPTPLEDTMRITCAIDANGTIWIGDGIRRRALADMAVFSNYVVLGLAGCWQFVNTSGQIVRELSHVQPVGADTIEALGAPQ